MSCQPKTRFSLRPSFAFEIAGAGSAALCVGVASEWFLFRELRRISRNAEQLAWFESAGRPLTSRALLSLNCYLRTGAIRHFKSRRWDDGRELLGWGEWCRFCRLLGLTFDGPGTGEGKSRRTLLIGFAGGPERSRWVRCGG